MLPGTKENCAKVQRAGGLRLNWAEMEADILGKIFQLLGSRSRCQAIPLVCKNWRRVDLERPPRISEFSLEDYHFHRDDVPSHASFLDWFSRAAREMTKLTIGWKQYLTPESKMPKMLDIAAERSPLIQLYFAPFSSPAVLKSISRMSQLQVLTIEFWPFRVAGDFAAFELLSGLTCLKVLKFGTYLYAEDKAAFSRDYSQLWSSLAKITALQTLKTMRHYPHHHLLHDVSTLVRLKSLTMDHTGTVEVLKGLTSALTNLTHLSIRSVPLDWCAASAISEMHLLKELKLAFRLSSPDNTHYGPLVSNQSITTLRLTCFNGYPNYYHTACDLGTLLPSYAPALGHLQQLALDGFTFPGAPRDRLPEDVLAAMTRLTFLRISQTNCSVMPAALPAAPSLRVLVMAFNEGFQLGRQDVTVIAQMPVLETLKIITRMGWELCASNYTTCGDHSGCKRRYGSCSQVLGCNSIYALLELRQRLPKLEIILEQKEGADYGVLEKGVEIWSGTQQIKYV